MGQLFYAAFVERLAERHDVFVREYTVPLDEPSPLHHKELGYEQTLDAISIYGFPRQLLPLGCVYSISSIALDLLARRRHQEGRPCQTTSPRSLVDRRKHPLVDR